jgi:hypothetical protein
VYTLSLPASIKNPRIRPFMSGAFVGTVPAEIPPPPLSKEEESQIVHTLLTELNKNSVSIWITTPPLSVVYRPRSPSTTQA